MRSFSMVLALVASTGLLAGDLTGNLSVVNHKGRTEKIDAGSAIIYLSGFKADIPAEMVSVDYQMGMENKQFAPRLMIIPLGATVQFPNLDPIIHNVFSVSGKNKFDGGSYAGGKGSSHTFDSKGLVRIFCNVHHRMNAIIYVTDNPYFATIGEDGSYELKNVPPGDYELRVLHVSGSRSREKISVSGDKMEINPKLKLLKPKPLRHLNKEGKPYKNRRSRRY